MASLKIMDGKQSSSPAGSRISMGKRLRRCSSIHCCGVQPNWMDFPAEIRRRLQRARKVYYPSRLYEDLYLSLGKQVFPGNYYRFMGHKIRQTELFQFLDIPHPKTRIFYGRSRRRRVLSEFKYPFVAKDPVGSSQGMGVWMIARDAELDAYLQRCRPAYIQEYLPLDRDLRVVLVAGCVLHAYWRIAREGEFRNNVSRGARISFEDIPGDALEFAKDVVKRCRFDDVGLDICFHEGRYLVIEANMVYGLEGFKQLGLDLRELLAELDRGGRL